MKCPKKYHGVVVPMISPFTEKGDIDLKAAQKITEHLVVSGTFPFILGTTGEGPSMSSVQRIHLAEAVVGQTNKRVTVYAGIGHLCLNDSIELAKRYFDIGIDVVVSQLPSYYSLSPDGMLRYYEMLATSIPGPLILYNIPLTTHMSIPLKVIDELSHHPKIVGIKDSEGDEKRFEESIALWKDRDDFSHFAGTETLAVKALLLGSDGIVPSTGNIIPKAYRDLYDAACSGDAQTATALWEKTLETSQIYLKNRTLDQSLPALKMIMNLQGFCEEIMLPPLYSSSIEEKAIIKKQLHEN
ncbi:dihydrodipicolinate synthase family protein [Simkania negevensis]|uniref:Dihydrodipicolinate synthase n=1 Tax=Simkania negevensis (strain ATCC VR-1471 / DSM 27360 / Z) TaxID=331113 RepID=F8L9A4_SIMNZ|nr:dihydrodipicolinate synthase family protein [Simkania negevensis]CCB89422.1 dihydrodipicolinate synthase [Simkania negevensis Z]